MSSAPRMDDVTMENVSFFFCIAKLLLTLQTHTVGRIQFGVLECVTAISTRPELSRRSCVQTEEAAARPHRTGWNTRTTGEAFQSCVGQIFFSFFFISFSLSVCFSLSSLFLFALPAWGKMICFKTRAKYYHIYIFLFQAGG